MPVISTDDGTEIQCNKGENLRRVLRNAGYPLYNPPAGLIHCRGLGTCGTCSLQITGEVSPPTKVERWRLNFPPHRAGAGLRLACQVTVEGDISVHKLSGLWGNKDHGQTTQG